MNRKYRLDVANVTELERLHWFLGDESVLMTIVSTDNGNDNDNGVWDCAEGGSTCLQNGSDC